MDFHLKRGGLDRWVSGRWDAALIFIGANLETIPTPVRRLVESLTAGGDFEAKAGHTMLVAQTDTVACGRLLLAGMGEGKPQELRKAAASAVAAVKGNPVVKSLGVAWGGAPGKELEADCLHAALLGFAEGTYAYTTTKTTQKATNGSTGMPKGRHLQKVEWVATNARGLQAQVALSDACIQGIELAKEWGNRPANHATPSDLAQVAQKIAKSAGSRFSCEVFGPKAIDKLGMGSFRAVAQASRQEARFIVLRYQGAAASVAPHVFVGKGITFDTGGISLKPAAEMDEMKFDMCGAASVLGLFQALAHWKPKVNVVGLIPSCENMPGGAALKPGDVVTSMSGQTIEVLNTDAEGRLILCDALTYAERFKPAAVIDIATLTGACVIALGHVRSGLFANTDALAEQLTRAGEESLDPCWRMPLDDEYADGLKTHFADVANVAGRAGGAVTAAKFLQRFAVKYPWAHLDIAGTAWKSGAAKGSTGRPVGLLLAYLAAQTRP